MVSDSSGSDQKYRFKPDIKVFNCIFCSKDRETNILFDGLQISGNVQLLNFQVWRLEQCERKERITQIWNKNWEFSWSTYMYVIWGTGSDPSAEFRSGSVSDHCNYLNPRQTCSISSLHGSNNTFQILNPIYGLSPRQLVVGYPASLISGPSLVFTGRETFEYWYSMITDKRSVDKQYLRKSVHGCNPLLGDFR